MKNINIETNYVRVIGNTDPDKVKNDMIGQECEVRSSDYEDNTISVWDKDHSNSRYFNKKDVRFLTPAKFYGKHIAIDDEVFVDGVWGKVLAFYIGGDGIRINIGIEKNTFNCLESHIEDHRTETPEIEMTIKQIEEKLNITGLKIIE